MNIDWKGKRLVRERIIKEGTKEGRKESGGKKTKPRMGTARKNEIKQYSQWGLARPSSL